MTPQEALHALEDAVREGDAGAVLRCLTASRQLDLNVPGDQGNSLVHRVVEKATLESALPLLLARGARVNAVNDNGATPLHRAVRAGHEAIATVLIRHRADLEHVNNRGRTPLYLATAEMRQRLEDVASQIEEAAAEEAHGGVAGRARLMASSVPSTSKVPQPTAANSASTTDAVAAAPIALADAPVAMESTTAATLTADGVTTVPTLSAHVPVELIARVVRRELQRLGGGPVDETEDDRMARLRSQIASLMDVLDASGLTWTPAVAAAAVRAALDSRRYCEALGSDLGALLHERVVAELRRVLTSFRRLDVDDAGGSGHGGGGSAAGIWGVTLLPVAMQLTLLLPNAEALARDESKVEAEAAVEAEVAPAPDMAAPAHPLVAIASASAAASAALSSSTPTAEAAQHAARVSRWSERLGVLHSALVREVVLEAITVPPALEACVPALHAEYATLGVGSELAQGATRVVKRFMSTTRPLLLRVDWALAASAPSVAPAASGTYAMGTTATAAPALATSAPPTPPPPCLPPPAAPPCTPPEYWFYKEGDDLLQDVGTTMLLHEMNVAWTVVGKPYFTPVYAVYPLRDLEACGFLECLPDSVPVSTVRRTRCASPRERHVSTRHVSTGDVSIGDATCPCSSPLRALSASTPTTRAHARRRRHAGGLLRVL